MLSINEALEFILQTKDPETILSALLSEEEEEKAHIPFFDKARLVSKGAALGYAAHALMPSIKSMIKQRRRSSMAPSERGQSYPQMGYSPQPQMMMPQQGYGQTQFMHPQTMQAQQVFPNYSPRF